MNNQSSLYYVLFHSPGDKWLKEISFREQPGIMEHVQYMSSFLKDKTLLIGGPFPDDTGGMMIIRAESKEAAESIAFRDPAVKNELLKVSVRPWIAALKSE